MISRAVSFSSSPVQERRPGIPSRSSRMERPLHAGGVAIEPSLEVVERHAHDRVAVSHRRFLLSHARTIAAVHHAAAFYGDLGTGETPTRPNLRMGLLVSCIRNCSEVSWCLDVASWASCRGDRVVGPAERRALERAVAVWVTAVRLARACGDGPGVRGMALSNAAVAQRVSRSVCRRRASGGPRFATQRLAGPEDEARAGRPKADLERRPRSSGPSCGGWARRAKTAQFLAMRRADRAWRAPDGIFEQCRGRSGGERDRGEPLAVPVRRRAGSDGLLDEQRPGRPP